jgi:transposase-like protein
MFQLFALVPDAETARRYLEAGLWPSGPTCPTCTKGSERVKARKGGYYRCNDCLLDFTVRTGTIMERSHIPLHKWMYAMYLVVTARKGISSMQLAKEIGITQKSAWFMLQRLREACAKPPSDNPDDTDDKLFGTVEVDECFIGGLEKNKHESKKRRSGRGPTGKAVVLGLRERGGRTRAVVVSGTDRATLQAAIRANVATGSSLMTDEHSAYAGLQGDVETGNRV